MADQIMHGTKNPWITTTYCGIPCTNDVKVYTTLTKADFAVNVTCPSCRVALKIDRVQ